MNSVHQSVIKSIREASIRSSSLSNLLTEKTDEQVTRLMFSNYRGRGQDSRGMRLTAFGNQIMRAVFDAFEVTTPNKRPLQPLELMYLDRKALLPYHLGDDGQITIFESELGIRLMLADGDVKTLVEMDALVHG